VLDRLLACISELEFCEHDPAASGCGSRPVPAGCSASSATRLPRVPWENIRCMACGQPAGDPDQDAIVVVKVTDWLGAHFCLCLSCTEADLRFAGHLADTAGRMPGSRQWPAAFTGCDRAIARRGPRGFRRARTEGQPAALAGRARGLGLRAAFFVTACLPCGGGKEMAAAPGGQSAAGVVLCLRLRW